MGGSLKIGQLEIESTDEATLVTNICGGGTLSGTSVQINDARITAATFVSIFPVGTKLGTWSVESFNGYFTVTSTSSENCAFKWSAVK